MIRRAPDFVIGDPAAPYLRRWWIIPRNRFFNIYLHQILRSDDDRALHDHPWWNVSIILKGGYFEITPDATHWRKPGSVVFRRATAAHRLQLQYVKKWDSWDKGNFSAPCWSLFITGPKIREWGFLCRDGWKHWREFIGVPEGDARGDEIGPGCGGA